MASTRESPHPQQTTNPIGQGTSSSTRTIEIDTSTSPNGNQISNKLFKFLFYTQLVLITLFSIVLCIHGAFSLHQQQQHLNPKQWYPPILASVASSALVALFWHFFLSIAPGKAFKSCFCISPLLTLILGAMFFFIHSPSGAVIGSITLAFGVSHVFYWRFVHSRFTYAIDILSTCTANPPMNTKYVVLLSTFIGVVYQLVLMAGIAGAIVIFPNHIIAIAFKALSLISLMWTMQVIKNVVLVTFSRLSYQDYITHPRFDNRNPFRSTLKNFMGSVSLGSILVPLHGLLRCSARSIILLIGETGHFAFAILNCYASVANHLQAHGNRWGFVYVGVHNKGIIQASLEVWGRFVLADMVRLINSDLTSSFCFLCGTSGAAVGALVAGGWTLSVHKTYTVEISIYAYMIGYFLSRVALAWLQACLSGYYVAYAENSLNRSFGTSAIISDRIQELKNQRYM